MVHYFKLGSWDRFILLLLVFGLLQVPYHLFFQGALVPELYWIRLGERMAQGWRLYAQAQTDTGPFPALVYAGLARLGILDVATLRYLATALVLAQALWLNRMAHKYQLITDRHFLLAFFYLIFAHVGPDALSLSPVLMATTFVLFATGRFFAILKEGSGSDDTVVLGLWLGLAVACYQPAALFLFSFYTSALFFTGLRLNQYLQMLVAMLLPTAGVYVFFLVGGGEAEFWTCFLSPFRFKAIESFVGWDLTIGIGGLLVLISLAGWAVANQNSRVNFQRLGFTVFFFSLIMAVLSIVPGASRSTDQLLFLVPHAAFFATQFMLHTRGFLMQEVLGLVLVLVFAGIFFGMADANFGRQILGHRLLAEDPPKGFMANFTGRSILVLADDARFIKHNPVATRYLRFGIAPTEPGWSQTHEGLIFWYQCLAEDPPALIYDPQQQIPALAVRIPEFGRCYKASFYPHLYEAIPGRRFGK
jgi:hypothetical protein